MTIRVKFWQCKEEYPIDFLRLLGFLNITQGLLIIFPLKRFYSEIALSMISSLYFHNP